MRTFIENYLHFMKNCIRPHYEKLKSLKSGFIENSIFKIIETPELDQWPHILVFLTTLLLVCSLGALRKPLDLQLLGSLEEGGQLLLGHVHLVVERERG